MFVANIAKNAQVDFQNLLSTGLLQVVLTILQITSYNKPDFNRPVALSLKFTLILWQLVDKLEQAGRIQNLQQVRAVFICADVLRPSLSNSYNSHIKTTIFYLLYINELQS